MNVVIGNIILLNDHIKLPKLKMVRIKQHREQPQDHMIKSCMISIKSTGKYYVDILTEYEKESVQKRNRNSCWIRLSNGSIIRQFYLEILGRLARAQRVLSRRTKGSIRWNKLRIHVAKLHEKVMNQRKNYLHHESKKFAANFDVVAIEDLNMKGRSQALHFGKVSLIMVGVCSLGAHVVLKYKK